MPRIAFAILLLLPLTAVADVKLHPLFTDHMVLQRNASVTLWGTASPGEQVTWTFTSKDGERFISITSSTTADDKGNWKGEIATGPASTGAALTVAGKNEIKLKDILIGDIWLCSGQSNMEMRIRELKQDERGAKAAAAAANPNIRFYEVPNVPHREPQASLVPTKTEGVWRECTPETVMSFSAVGYFFGRDIEKSQSVPVGLIATDWGGTPCQSWTSKEGLAAEPSLKHYLDALATVDEEKAMAAYEAALTKHKEAVAKAKADGKPAPRAPTKPVNGGVHSHVPTALFNGMIAPLRNFKIKGAIWYQGESNAGRAQEYRTLFPAMIKDWRKQWGEELPFFVVQLAPFQADGSAKVSYAELRDAQAFAAKTLPKVGLAVITDAGDEKDIHPQRKEPAGARLALAARAIAYGEKIDYSGPVYKSHKIDGSQVILEFDHLGGGLMCKGDALAGFTLCGEDKQFHAAKAEIKGDKVVVTCDKVVKPVAVRFGWVNFAKPELNFFNKADLPAVPFRTDDFPLTTK